VRASGGRHGANVLFDHAIRIGRLEPVDRVGAGETLQIPPRQAILQRHDHGVIAEQRAHSRRHLCYRVSLQRREHEVWHNGIDATRHRAQVLRDFLRAVVVNEFGFRC